MSSLHSIERGSKSAEVPDYYEEGCPIVTIPLDPALSPQQNAAQYFKKYAKQKRTSKLIDDQIAECKDMLEYLRGVEVSINACESAEDIAELERELEEAGAPGMRKAAKGARKPKPTAPLLYDIDGFTVAAVIGNALVMGMEAVLVVIQVMRLEYYEFFGKFYKGGGSAFKPVGWKRDRGKYSKTSAEEI